MILFFIRASLEILRSESYIGIVLIHHIAHTIATVTLCECDEEFSLRILDDDHAIFLLLACFIVCCLDGFISRTSEDDPACGDHSIPEWFIAFRLEVTTYGWSECDTGCSERESRIWIGVGISYRSFTTA